MANAMKTLTVNGQTFEIVDDQARIALEGKVNGSGWTANIYLGTDAEGNVVEKSRPESGGGGDGTLPVASNDTLGGVMPVTKTDAMTQEVGVDAEGKLYTEPGSGDISAVTAEIIDEVLCVSQSATTYTASVIDGVLCLK